MKRLARSLLPLLTVLAGCAASQPAPPYPPVAFDHRVADTHVEVYWTCTQAQPNVLQVDGVARSPWTEVRFMEVELVTVNGQGRRIDASRTAVPDVVLRTNTSSPFRLLLPLTGAEARTDLYYEYRYRAEPDSLLGVPRFGTEFQRSFVRDACSPAQHRAG